MLVMASPANETLTRLGSTTLETPRQKFHWEIDLFWILPIFLQFTKEAKADEEKKWAFKKGENDEKDVSLSFVL